MKLLAIDTSSACCSVALVDDGRLLQRSVATARDHARLLLPLVDSVLAEAGTRLPALDGIAFGCGPGSFTGLRITAAVTQGLAAGADLPVLPVSSLRALAEQARAAAEPVAGGWLLACMDARMGEVYWGLFADGPLPVPAAAGGERLTAPQDLPAVLADLLPPGGRLRAGAGMGLGAWPALAGLLQSGGHCLPAAEPQAADVARLAMADLAAGAAWRDPAAAQPVYLRDRVVQIPKPGPGL